MKTKITTILPVSRIEFLDRVLQSLLDQTFKVRNLLVIVDGDDDFFVRVRNKIAEVDIEDKLCVKSLNSAVGETIYDRRVNICNIHNQTRGLIGECDWIFSVEDDGLLPADALERLTQAPKDTGLITGVELGRRGTPYVGAWRVDDPFTPKKVISLAQSSGVEDIDASGLYCALVRTDLYRQHVFFCNNGLGPDINLGLFSRQQGYKNYIDWDVGVTHLTDRGQIPATTPAQVVEMNRVGGSWIISRLT